MKHIIDIPFKDGFWKVLCTPGNHEHARDFVKVKLDKNGTRVKKSFLGKLFGFDKAKSFYCWNEPLFAPITGKVVWTDDGLEDNHYVNIFTTLKVWLYATYIFYPKEMDGM